MDNLYVPNKIRTFTGLYINPFDPKPEEISIFDIAHSLAHICRFNGHSKRFLSVAEHSLFVSDKLPDELKLQGLLHDASEAYLMDIPTPVKKQLPGYYEAEERLLIVIADKYGFDYPFHTLLKTADKLQLEYEWENQVLNNVIPTLDSEMAEHLFMKEFNRLFR